jgi:RNA polymerase sigma-70 factor (ECF subfamily)
LLAAGIGHSVTLVASTQAGLTPMSQAHPPLNQALAPLQAGDLERFRAYLGLLARLEVAPRLRDKVDLSGVVQQTLLEAFQGLSADPRRRKTDAETAAWLRSILSHNLADVLRKLKARKRDVRMEWSLEDALGASASRLEKWLAADESSPSQRVMHQEELLRMVATLATLPESQRRAIELHHLEGWPIAEIAAEIGTTKAAVAGLLHRGLKNLRMQLASPG